MKPFSHFIALILAAGLVPAAPALAQSDSIVDRRGGSETGVEWTWDDFTSPDGVAYKVTGMLSRFDLKGRFPLSGLNATWLQGQLETSYTGAFTPMTRTDTNENFNRLGNRLLATWSQGRYHKFEAVEEYFVDMGVGLLADHTMHLTGGAPVGRNRDYLDEGQLRIGPVGRLDILWLHPEDDAWTAHLNLLVGPRLLSITSGNVPFPGGFTGAEVSLGPQWRYEDAELSGGGILRMWVGDSFFQRQVGLFLRGTYRF